MAAANVVEMLLDEESATWPGSLTSSAAHLADRQPTNQTEHYDIVLL